MAVPKKKTSKSKRNMRRGSNGTYALKIPNVVVNKEGEYTLSHHIAEDGSYKGRKIIEDKPKPKVEAEKSS